MQPPTDFEKKLQPSLITPAIGPLFFIFFSKFFNWPFVDIVLMAISYYWMALIDHPGLKDRAESRQYRFSFVRFIYLIDSKIQTLIEKISSVIKKDRILLVIRPVLRSLPPLALCFTMVYFSTKGSYLSGLFGCFCYLIANLFERKLIARK